MNRKLLRGLVLDAAGRGDCIPQRLRYLVEPIALAGNISYVLRLLFVDHSVPLIGISPTRDHGELQTVIGVGNWPHAQRHWSTCRPVAGGVGRADALFDKPLAHHCRTGEDGSARGRWWHIYCGGTYLLDTTAILARSSVSSYATAHLTEDWSETFAHHLQPLIFFQRGLVGLAASTIRLFHRRVFALYWSISDADPWRLASAALTVSTAGSKRSGSQIRSSRDTAALGTNAQPIPARAQLTEILCSAGKPRSEEHSRRVRSRISPRQRTRSASECSVRVCAFVPSMSPWAQTMATDDFVQ